MTKTLPLILSLVILSGPALAQDRGPGSGSDIYRVQREWEAMLRDGRYQRLLEEGRANKQAFDQLRQQQQADPTATGSTAPRRR